MGTQNQDSNKQSQSAGGQQTQPSDPKLNQTKDSGNQIDRKMSDQGQGRDQSASDKSMSRDADQSEDKGSKPGEPRTKSANTEQSDSQR